MLAAILLALGCAFSQNNEDPNYSDAVDTALIAPLKRSGARFEFAPAKAEVGQAVELVLYVPHAADEQVSCDTAALEADPSWVVLDGPMRSTTPDPQDHERALTRVRWKVASLEAGTRQLPEIDVKLASKSNAPHSVSHTTSSLEAQAVLAADEDAPRAPKGFREIEPEPASRATLAWTIGAIAFAALAGIALGLWIAKRRRPKPAPAPSRLELIDALARRDVEQPAVVREVHYELARLLREVFDSRHGVARTALTDEEWLQSVASTFTPEHLRELAEVLRISAEVKYGAAQPTQWAVRETIERARRVAGTGANAVAPQGVAA